MNAHFFTRLPKLRAIWAIIRNGAVIWNADLSGTDGHLETTAGKERPGIVIVRNLTINGQAIDLDDINPATGLQTAVGDVNVAADEDIEVSD